MVMGNPVAVHPARNSALSLFQSAVHSVLLQKGLSSELQGIGATAAHSAMVATSQVVQHFDANGNFDVPAPGPSSTPASGTAPATAPPATAPPAVLECAKLAADIALKAAIDPARAAQLRDTLTASSCDPLWAEVLAVYEASRVSGGQQRYDKYSDIKDFVVNDCFNDEATIAVIGDWGTGMNDALVLLQQIADNFEPDVLLHLGDIYYSGLPDECSNHFSKLIDQVWPASGNKPRPLVFTRAGTHDRYAGANGGYYELIQSLNKDPDKRQPNSYFALRNNFWQFVAMDTSYYDADPRNVNDNVTKLVPEEVTWHLDKI